MLYVHKQKLMIHWKIIQPQNIKKVLAQVKSHHYILFPIAKIHEETLKQEVNTFKKMVYENKKNNAK